MASDTLEQRVIEWLTKEGLDVGGAPLARGTSLVDFVRKECELALAGRDRREGKELTVRTENCVRCMKPAKVWSGHVIRERQHLQPIGIEKISAGWCSEECSKRISEIVSPTGAGCMGRWHVGLGTMA